MLVICYCVIKLFSHFTTMQMRSKDGKQRTIQLIGKLKAEFNSLTEIKSINNEHL